MKLLMLGSGTSTGVPRLGDEWGECDPRDPRNRRTRVSIIVESAEGVRLLVDTSPDLRHQLLAAGIATVDAVFWTHDHADHCHGIDDLRPMRFDRTAPIPGFASSDTARRLKQRFSYAFSGRYGYPTIIHLEAVDGIRLHQGFAIGWVEMPHGPGASTGYRFDCDDKSIAYATDYSEITDDMVTLFQGVDVLVSDCLRREPHPTHASLAMALELARRSRAKLTVLTHLDKSMDYAALSDELPPSVRVGFDGLEVTP